MKFLLKKKHQIILLFFLTTILLQFHHDLSSDTGVILNGAWNMYNHQILYKDFFEYIAPGSFYLIYLVFVIFGPSYLAASIFSVLILWLGTYIFYRLILLLDLGQSKAVIGSFIWLIATSLAYPIVNHNFYSTVTTLLLLYIVFLFINKQKQRYLYFMGLLAALTFYFLQTKGLLFIVALTLLLIFYIWRYQKSVRFLFHYLLGLATIIIPATIYWGLVVWTAPLEISSLYWAVNQAGWQKPIVVIIIFIATFAYLFWQKKNSLLVSILALWQILLYISIINRPDIQHVLLNSYPLILGLLVFSASPLANLLLSAKISWLKYTVYTAIILVYGAIGAKFLDRLQATLDNENYLDNMRRLVAQEQIFAHPFLPEMYLELKRPNNYYTNVVETIQGNPQFLEKNFLVLIQEKPKYIFTHYGIVQKFNYQLNIIDYYILANYIPTNEYYGLQLWERK